MLQKTTTGLAVSVESRSSVSFTDGWQHWTMREGALTHWEGSEAPPIGTPNVAPVNPASTPSGVVPVANTGGVGVVLRSAPTQSARLPAGFMEGTQLQILQRQGEWVKVQAVNGRSGWVPAQYVEPIEMPHA